MSETNVDIHVDQIKMALEAERVQDAVGILGALRPADRADAFNLLAPHQQDVLLPLLDISTAADLLEELEDEDALDAVASLGPDHLADVLDEMEPDEAADLLGDLSPEAMSKALSMMEDADEVIPLLGYPDETAGGLMTTSYIALRANTIAEQAIQFLRQISLDIELPYYLYVIDREKRLRGVVGFRELVIANPHTKIENIMDPEVIHVNAGIDQEEVARIMSRYDLTALPVLDQEQRLLGVITHDDIVDVLQEEATEDIYRLSNVADSDLDPNSSISDQLKGRLPWIYLNSLTALIASWVISRFESLFVEVAILAAFQSVVAGLGGNSASQNVAMIVRSIALGKMDTRKIWPVITRQLMVGLIQGVAVGVVLGISVALWRDNYYLGLIIGLAMIGNMLIAGLVGTLVPLGLRAFGLDPAIASSVLVTAATDSFGFFIFLTLATWFLSYLI